MSDVGKMFAMKYGTTEEGRMLPLWELKRASDGNDDLDFVMVPLVKGSIIVVSEHEGQMRRLVTSSGVVGWFEDSWSSWNKTFVEVPEEEMT